MGKVIAVRPHDNAEHLQVNEVNFGDSLGHKIIVTGRKGERAISLGHECVVFDEY